MRNSGWQNIDAYEVAEYYKTHSKPETAKHFHICYLTINKILATINFVKTREDVINTWTKTYANNHFRSNYTNFLSMWPEIKAFYEKHNAEKTCKHFNILKGVLQDLCKHFNYHKDKKLVYEQRDDDYFEKYGIKSALCDKKIRDSGLVKANSKEAQKKKKITMIKHYGSLDSAYTIRDAKIQKTTLKKYGVKYYNAAKKYNYNNNTFDSLPELAYYIYCINHNIDIVRTPIELSYTFKNKKHIYYPDFRVNGKLVEIKGDHLIKKLLQENTQANAKYKCMLENNVTILTYKDYKFALKYLKDQHIDVNQYRIYAQKESKI